MGTITNANGFYKMPVNIGTQTLVYSYLGYLPETLHTNVTGNITYNTALHPSPIQLQEFIVIAEDPAIEIIRKAIANKRKWMDKLESYCFEAYTRRVLWRDTSIASIMESYTTGYMKTRDTLREVVKQKRQTQNIPMDENLAAVGRIVNFNDDRINLLTVRFGANPLGYTFIGPTAPKALDYYEYKLLNTSIVNGIEVYQIKIQPKSRLIPLFQGIITIADETYAVMGVDLKPNETFNIPFIKKIDLRYRQQFALYDSIFWMPVDIRTNGEIEVGMIGFKLPKIGIDVTSSIYKYTVNAIIPDSIFQKPRLSIDSALAVLDSTFWKTHEVIPLTADEAKAYQTLDSAQTLQKQFRPGGPLTIMGDEGVMTFLKYADIYFNRGEGFYFGGKFDLDTLTPTIKLNGSVGYGFFDRRFKYNIGGTFFYSKERTLGLGMNVFRRVSNIPDGEFHGKFYISLMALIDKNDYRDYFLLQGWRIFLKAVPSKILNMKLNFLNERHYSILEQTNYSLFSSHKSFRKNPPVTDGTLRCFQIDFSLSEPRDLLDFTEKNSIDVSVENSSPLFCQ